MENEAVAEQSAPIVEAETLNAVDVKPEATAADGEEVKQEAPAEKTFTQAEVDALVQKRLLKAERSAHRRIESQMREQAQRQAIEQEPKREDFRDDDAYLKAHVERLAEIRATEKLEERKQAESAQQRSESFLEKAEKVSAVYPDFEAVVSNPNLHISSDMAEFIAESDKGAEVAYFLGKNPTKAAGIAQMSPIGAARELARIEAELVSKPTVKTSSAPAPITPVGNRGSMQTSLANADFAEYKKQRLSMNPSWRR